jgi:hypothetical protein
MSQTWQGMFAPTRRSLAVSTARQTGIFAAARWERDRTARPRIGSSGVASP